MTKNEVIAERKVHLLFAGGLLVFLIVSITTEIIAGQSFLLAIWNTLSEIRPMEYAMILLFWYFCAFHKTQDEWNSSFTTLNLRR